MLYSSWRCKWCCMNLTLWIAFSSSNGYFFLMAAGTSLSASSMDDAATCISRLAAPAAAVPLQPVRPVDPENRHSDSVGERWPAGGEPTGAGGTFNVAPTLAAFNLCGEQTKISIRWRVAVYAVRLAGQTSGFRRGNK